MRLKALVGPDGPRDGVNRPEANPAIAESESLRRSLTLTCIRAGFLFQSAFGQGASERPFETADYKPFIFGNVSRPVLKLTAKFSFQDSPSEQVIQAQRVATLGAGERQPVPLTDTSSARLPAGGSRARLLLPLPGWWWWSVCLECGRRKPCSR